MNEKELPLKNRKRLVDKLHAFYRQDSFSSIPTCVISLLVFVATLRVFSGYFLKNRLLLMYWLNEYELGFSIFQSLKFINILFGLSITLGFASLYQRWRQRTAWHILYYVLCIGMLVYLHHGYILGERMMNAYSDRLGPFVYQSFPETDLPQVESPYSSDWNNWIERPLWVDITENSLVVGENNQSTISLDNGKLLANGARLSEENAFIEELGELMLAEHKLLKQRYPRTAVGTKFHGVYELTAEAFPATRFWPKKGGKALVLVADREIPFRTVQEVIVSAGRKDYSEWYIVLESEGVTFPRPTMKFPRYFLLRPPKGEDDGTHFREKEIIIEVESERFNVSYGDPAEYCTPDAAERISKTKTVIEGENRYDLLTKHLYELKARDRSLMSCILRIAPEIPVQELVRTINRVIGSTWEPMLPMTSFMDPACEDRLSGPKNVL